MQLPTPHFLMKLIPLTQGKLAIVDDTDFEYLNKWCWYYDSTTGYARRGEGNKRIYMHRVINNTPKGLITDHINRNTLDNRRENLRTVSRAGNQRNHKLFSHNTSGYNGVSWSKIMRKWEAYIWRDNKKINLGFFKNPGLAYSARLKGEILYW